MPPKGDRSARIAAAVQRSKTEYQPQHAYTERDEAHLNWLSEGGGVGAGTGRVGSGAGGKYGLEYLAARTYNAGLSGASEAADEEGQALDVIYGKVERNKPLGGLSREVVDSAIGIAVRRGDERAGLLADLSKSCTSVALPKAVCLPAPCPMISKFDMEKWKAPHVGIALHAAKAYIMLGRYHDAVEPLLQASLAGIHHPILALLVEVLDKLLASGTTSSSPPTESQSPTDEAREQLEGFRSLVISRRDRMTYSYDLFPTSPSSKPFVEKDNIAQNGDGERDADPRAGSILSKLADIEIGANQVPPSISSKPASNAPRSDASMSVHSVPAPTLDEQSSSAAHGIAAETEIDIAKLATALQVQEGTVRMVMGRLTKHMGGPSAEDGKESADRGVREL